MKLSDAKIRALKPKAKLYRVADGHGLCIEVVPNGAKHWRYRHQWNGRPSMLSLGQYPEVGLAAARDLMVDARRALRSGQHPGSVRPNPRVLAARSIETLFSTVAEAWRKEKQRGLADKTSAKIDAILDHDLIPSLGKADIGTLATPEAASAIELIAIRAPHVAQKAKSYLNQIIDFAIRKGLREDGKKLTLKGTVKLPKAKSFPAAVSEESLREVVAVLDGYPDKVVRSALWLAAYTALRPSNVVSARWSAINLDTATWRIPESEMKTGEPHELPLPKQAIALLRDAQGWRRGGSKEDWVFPAISERKTPHMCRDTLSKALRDSGLAGKHVPHGFRASLRTMAREELDADIDALEAQLAHSVGDATQRAYNRARLLKKRVEIMQQWADYLDRLINASREKPTI